MEVGCERCAHSFLLPGNNKYTLNVNIIKFDCSQYARREAHVDWLVTLVENSSGKEVYNKQIKADKVNGSMITFDSAIFASVDDLRKVANEALQDSVDQLLNDREFISKIK